ncbi:GNAT family N-acetyltransferase [Chitinilyticum litopenaei]|uniref:GNAT family N-acetyltransferase n=1 Tax=Chitinilyticum litopenaei TaxID=1121276 RepID=UPI0004054AC8|nr:GNAT family N-acetyltransferase [Chitinilyticum litopenaei]
MRSSLTTARLTLRCFTPADFDALFALTRQPEITDILPDWAMSAAQLQDYLHWWQDNYPQFDPQKPAWLYAVCLTASGELIGWVGLWPKEGLDSPFPEVAYALSRDHRRQGYMSEAVIAACSELHTQCPDLPAIVAIVKDWHAASRGVVTRAGFLPRGTATLPDDGEFDFFVLPRPQLARRFPVRLRPARESEAGLLAALQTAAYREHARRWGPWNPDASAAAGPGGHDSPELIRYLIRSAHYLVIEAGGVMAGAVCVEGPYGREGYIAWLFIDPALGKQGLGQQALAALDAQFPEVDCWNLGTSLRSEDNRRFYLRCGYQETGCDAAFRYFRRQRRESQPQPGHYSGVALAQPYWHDSLLNEALFYDCALPGLRLANSTMIDAHFHNVNVTGLRIGDARLAGLELCHASWGGAYLHDLARGWHDDHAPVRLERVDLGSASIADCELRDARLVDCDLRDARIEGGRLDGLLIAGVPYAELRAAWEARLAAPQTA